MRKRCLRTLKKLWSRYNPRRFHIEVNDDEIVFLSQLGYIELYRGEWFFTDKGLERVKAGLKEAEKRHANVRTRNFICK
jgi:hypothetical protein